jgi:uncharacterized membrane protein YkoI
LSSNRYNQRSAQRGGPHARRVVAFVITLLLASSVAARPRPGAAVDPLPATEDLAIDGAIAQRGQISLQQAIELAQRRYPGRVVRADTTMSNGRVVHIVRILGDDGRVRTVQIDAQSGSVR